LDSRKRDFCEIWRRSGCWLQAVPSNTIFLHFSVKLSSLFLLLGGSRRSQSSCNRSWAHLSPVFFFPGGGYEWGLLLPPVSLEYEKASPFLKLFLAGMASLSRASFLENTF